MNEEILSIDRDYRPKRVLCSVWSGTYFRSSILNVKGSYTPHYADVWPKTEFLGMMRDIVQAIQKTKASNKYSLKTGG